MCTNMYPLFEKTVIEKIISRRNHLSFREFLFMLIAGGHKSMQPNDFKFETTIVVNEADMIKKINKNDINECVSLIRESFSTVAENLD